MKNKNFKYTDTDNRILSGSKNTAENGNLNQLKNRIYTARIISITISQRMDISPEENISSP